MTSIRKSDPGLFNMLYGSFGFPMGLTLCVVAGAELFTSNVAYMVLAFAEGRCSILQLLYVWVGSWVANLFGALFLMQLFFSGKSQQLQLLLPLLITALPVALHRPCLHCICLQANASARI
jgi:formate/nitrite transporter FocA (FNT family)